MATWKKRTLGPKTSATISRGNPRNYADHPFGSTLKGTHPTQRTGKGKRHAGLGAKNPDGKAKM